MATAGNKSRHFVIGRCALVLELVSKGYAKGLTELGACATFKDRAKRVLILTPEGD